MQVNSIQSSPNFGMALRVTPAAREALEKESVEALEHIEQVGKDVLARHKHVDVVLEEGARPVVKTKFANAYKAPFVANQSGTFLTVETNWVGPEVVNGFKVRDGYRATYDLGTEEAALDACSKINIAPTDFDSAVEFAEAIEKRCNLQNLKDIAEREKLEVQRLKTDDLFKQFGKFEV